MAQPSIEIAIQSSKTLTRGILARSLLINYVQHQAALDHEKWQAQTKVLGQLLQQSEALTGDSVDALEQFLVRSHLIRAYKRCAEDYLFDLQSQAKVNQILFSAIYESDGILQQLTTE